MPKKFDSITEAQADFVLKLLRCQYNGDASIVFSPISIATAMAMIYLGAQGDTAKQIKDILAEGFKDSEINKYFTTFIKRVKKEYAVKEPSPSEREDYGEHDNPYSSWPILESVNRAYINENLILKDDFLEKLNQFISDGIEKVNFAEKAAVAEKINTFVAELTRNNINNIVSEENFDAKLSQIVLVNVIYFKGRWQDEFPKLNTKEEKFYLSPEKIKKVQMMKKEAQKFRYSDSSDFQFLSLPYRHSDLSMKIILPKKKFGLDELITNLTAEELMKHLSKKKYVDVKVKIPKFDIKTKFHAKEALQSMGIKDVLEKNIANLEGITDLKPFWLSSVLHSAFICIDEEGTEAGATTIADLRGCGFWSPPKPPRPIKFTADHPFLYLITDEQSNIYFCGVITGSEFDENNTSNEVSSNSSQQEKKHFKNSVTEFARKIFGKKS